LHNVRLMQDPLEIASQVLPLDKQTRLLGRMNDLRNVLSSSKLFSLSGRVLNLLAVEILTLRIALGPILRVRSLNRELFCSRRCWVVKNWSLPFRKVRDKCWVWSAKAQAIAVPMTYCIFAANDSWVLVL